MLQFEKIAVLQVNSSISENLLESQLLTPLKKCDFQIECATVGENQQEIAVQVNDLYESNDILIIVGNLSSGHIFKAIATLSGQKLEFNDRLYEILKRYSEPSEEECRLPACAKFLTEKSQLNYPIIHFQRIFFVNEKFAENILTQNFVTYLNTYRQNVVYRKNYLIANNGLDLDGFDSQKVDEGVKLTVESRSFEELVENEVKVRVKLGLPILDSTFLVPKNSVEPEAFEQDEHITLALSNIELCLTKYGPENIFLCFNGGKDCTVLLHLVYTILKTKFPNYKDPLFCLYVVSSAPFSAQEEFISNCERVFNLKVVRIQSSIQAALQQVLDSNTNFRACFMGTRRTDPFSTDLQLFQMTDASWPQIMRVHPILNWHYSDIWDYLLFYNVPYCKLYDDGFTSLGDSKNTTENPCLLLARKKQTFVPAYKLLNEGKERDGRNKILP